MPAYIVAHTTIHDFKGYSASEYPAVLKQLFEKYQCTPIGVGLHELLEGAELGAVTVIDQFPDIDTARAFWNDPWAWRGSTDRLVVLIMPPGRRRRG